VLTLNQVCGFKFQVFTGSPIHPPLGALTIGSDYVRLPEEIVIGYTYTEDSINKLIVDIFPSLEENARSIAYMSTCAILSTKNQHVD
jgi:hypothetical protein